MKINFVEHAAEYLGGKAGGTIYNLGNVEKLTRSLLKNINNTFEDANDHIESKALAQEFNNMSTGDLVMAVAKRAGRSHIENALYTASGGAALGLKTIISTVEGFKNQENLHLGIIEAASGVAVEYPVSYDNIAASNNPDHPLNKNSLPGYQTGKIKFPNGQKYTLLADATNILGGDNGVNAIILNDEGKFAGEKFWAEIEKLKTGSPEEQAEVYEINSVLHGVAYDAFNEMEPFITKYDKNGGFTKDRDAMDNYTDIIQDKLTNINFTSTLVKKAIELEGDYQAQKALNQLEPEPDIHALNVKQDPANDSLNEENNTPSQLNP